MNHWIFQGNPDVFDIGTYLARNDQIRWLVRQHHYSKAMKPGDEVFLWRAAGKAKAPSGVVAIAHITSEPGLMQDDPAAQSLWKEGDPKNVALRVHLAISQRRLGSKETIRREWIKDDPDLKDMHILKMANQTNYHITSAEAERLAMLCRSVGSDWSREEDLAALWAFKETEGGPVSRAQGSPVAIVAALIGRPIGGVYNKVMNFRSVDSRDARKGLSNINQLDREIWAEYYDSATRTLLTEKLDADFGRLWPRTVAFRARRPKYADFGEAPDDDPNDLATFAAKVRKGQPQFRANLRTLYEDKCALSGWGPPEVLEAAHIYGHAESGINHTDNGLLLRADLHALMDAGLLRIEPASLTIIIDDALTNTEYWLLHGKTLRPRSDGSQPRSDYLALRFEAPA